MLRVVVDPGVLISALISPSGTPSTVLRRWLGGELQIICSDHLIAEFREVGARERMRRWFEPAEVEAVARLLREGSEWHADTALEGPTPSDPKDAYLVALAASAGADCLCTGDTALLAHSAAIRIVAPRALLRTLDELNDPDVAR